MTSNLTPETRERLVRLIYDTQAIQEEHQPWDCLPEWRADYFRRAIDALAHAWPQPAPAGEADVAAIRARWAKVVHGKWSIAGRPPCVVAESAFSRALVCIGQDSNVPGQQDDWDTLSAIAAAPADIDLLLARVAALEAERDSWRDEYERVRADRDSYADGVFNTLSELEGYKHDADCYRELIALLAPHACTCGANVPDASRHTPMCRYTACVCTVDGTVPDGVDTDAGNDDEEHDSEY